MKETFWTLSDYLDFPSVIRKTLYIEFLAWFFEFRIIKSLLYSVSHRWPKIIERVIFKGGNFPKTTSCCVGIYNTSTDSFTKAVTYTTVVGPLFESHDNNTNEKLPQKFRSKFHYCYLPENIRNLFGYHAESFSVYR